MELILSGSKFKVRINEHSCYILLNLKGIKVLPNDPNVEEYEKWSNEALKFAKNRLT